MTLDVSSSATVLESMQKELAVAMPGLHTLTVCDFTTFYRKGKVRPLEVLQKDTAGTFYPVVQQIDVHR